ncbi:hypothetical protein F3J44_18320 [Pantoea sp. Tr-811]|uniref:hypothetical protein n=1 Tax=Pantoea sp. Tr-811 TaxID=2608361 RepID=UPI00142138AC|nr:hypothetical protein [Pantoea sp. Tr-811]NIF28326.1 hypothetical protein [Pantoea sp. Tr-811]
MSAAFVARLCYQSGLFRSAEKALRESFDLSGGVISEDDSRRYGPLPKIVGYLDEHGLDEKEIAVRLEVASRVVIEMAGPLTTFSVGGGEWGITFEYTVEDEIERLVEIDFAVTRKLVATFEDTLSQHISIGVTPFSESETDAD